MPSMPSCRALGAKDRGRRAAPSTSSTPSCRTLETILNAIDATVMRPQSHGRDEADGKLIVCLVLAVNPITVNSLVLKGTIINTLLHRSVLLATAPHIHLEDVAPGYITFKHYS